MRKFTLLACVAAMTSVFGAASLIQADKAPGTDTGRDGALLIQDRKLPTPKDLKIVEGTDEGHKTPLEVVTRAIKAAKDKKLADLKACMNDDGRRTADEKSYALGSDNMTNLQHVAKVLASYKDEGLTVLNQGTVGHYAVVMCQSPLGTHMVRVSRQGLQIQGKDGKNEKGPQNWYLSNYGPDEYQRDYGSPKVKTLIDAINKGDVAKLKEFLQQHETSGLDLLVGVKEGADPYDLLCQRLRSIINNGEGRPTILISRYGNNAAFWFHSEKGSTFIVLNFWTEYEDWESKKLTTEMRVSFGETARFHTYAADAFKNFVEDYDYSNWK
ncbi:MAG: hypothetical protein HS108_11255 [Planctomycetes bacterium]|nr:hypothetical protein [Planctomycetota bacterium]MCL4729700.1 hypothetical protein [Planctomycetota bacterium]